MELRDLRYFEAAAEAQHLGRAAGTVHRSQPALTKSIRRLEAELGAALFERAGRRIRLTQVGEVLLLRARAMRRAMQETEQEVRDFASGAAGHVRLGASATAAEFLLPPLTAALIERAPGVTLDLVVGMNDVLIRALGAGELDIVICPLGPAVPGLAVHTIAADPVVVVAGSAHPLFARRGVKLADLCDWPWVLPAHSAASREWLDGVFERHGLPRPRAQIQSGEISLIPRLISQTSLLSFISRRNLRMDRVQATLREIPLRETTLARDFGMLWREAAYLSPAAQRVRQLVQAKGRAMFARRRQ